MSGGRVRSWQRLDFDGEDGREVVDDGGPGVAGVGGSVDLAAGGAEVEAALIESVDGHGVAEDVDVAVLLGEALGERFPLVAAGAGAEDAEGAIEREMFGVAFDGDDEDGFGFVRVDVDGEAEVGGKVPADLVPLVTGVIGAHDVPVFLHKEGVGTCRVHGDVVDAVADLGGGIGDVFGVEAAVDGAPGETGVVCAESASGGDGDDDAVGICGVEEDGVEAHAAGAGLPMGAGLLGAETGELLPGEACVGGAEEGGVLDAREDGVGVGEGRFKVPDAFELPRVRGAVVPLVGGGSGLVREAVADGIPGFAAVVGALDELAEPAGGL